MLLDDHVTSDVTSWLVRSLKVTSAFNCWLVPSVMLGLAVMAKLAGAAPVTVNGDVEAFTDPNTAEIFELPAPTALARPAVVSKSSTVATDESGEFHCRSEVMSCCVLSENVTVALNC